MAIVTRKDLVDRFNKDVLYGGGIPLPPIICGDGFEMSVQASRSHLSSPKIDSDDFSVYTKYEVGYPSDVEPRLVPYIEEESRGRIFSFVPIEVIVSIINDHGGFENE